jgi:hypothetical protein
MSESPLFKARQAELAKRGVSRTAVNVQEIIAEKEEQMKAFKEEAKKAKKAAETAQESEVPKEVFPPVLENKAIQPEEVKEEIKEDEEML